MSPRSAARPRVLLVSSHPLALRELRRLAGPRGDRAVERRYAEVLSDPVDVGELAACVVDTSGPAPSRDAVIAGLLDSDAALPVVVLADAFDERDAVRLLQMGVKGLIRYSAAAEQLPRALGAVAEGAYWAPRALIGRVIDSLQKPGARALGSRASLSRREEEVLSAVLENLSNKEIGQRLDISERTVKFHVSNLLAKFGVARRTDLILETLHDRRPPLRG